MALWWWKKRRSTPSRKSPPPDSSPPPIPHPGWAAWSNPALNRKQQTRKQYVPSQLWKLSSKRSFYLASCSPRTAQTLRRPRVYGESGGLRRMVPLQSRNGTFLGHDRTREPRTPRRLIPPGSASLDGGALRGAIPLRTRNNKRENKTMKSALKPCCPYGTYQRATSGLPISAITPKILFRGLHSRLKPSVRRSNKFRDARHALLLGGLEHLANDREVMRAFRF